VSVVTSDPLFLGVDLGTTSLKCGLFDLGGRCAAAARVSYPTHESQDGAQQQCADWWTALAGGVRRAAAEVDRGRVAAVCVAGHAPSPVLVDANLQAVCPVLPWFDRRFSAERDALARALGRRPENGAGRLMVELAGRAMWLRNVAPRQFARAACILHSGDWLVARLTGQRVTSSPNVPEVFAAAELPLSLLPERVCRPGELVGTILSDVACELGLDGGVKVVAGGLDSFVASVGSGMRAPGDACLNTGSSSVVALLTASACQGRFEWLGYQMLSRPTWPGGRILEKARGPDDGDGALADQLVRAADLRPPLEIHGLLPELLRQADCEFPDARSILAAMAERHSSVEVVRLLVDAIFVRQRLVLEELEQHGEPARRVRSVGRLAACPAVVQLQADILGRTVEVPQTTDSGMLGCATLVAVALGGCTGAEAAARMARADRIYDPRGDVAARYDDIFAQSSAWERRT
jgi:sugar (pentulose or hexulose) kinase